MLRSPNCETRPAWRGPLEVTPADPTLMSRWDAPRAELRAGAAHPWERPELAAGQVLGGRYRVDRRVGAGGMGEVWSAEHVAIHMKVAVKLLLAHALCVPEIVARFEREAVLLGRACGDHVPHAIDFLVDDLYGPILVTEFVEGASLADLLRGPLSTEAAVDLGIELATGLAELHRAGVVHRDLKPGNVILRPVGDGSTRAVIIDLGVSRLVRESTTVRATTEDISTDEIVVGTIEYMAPEQILHCREVTPAADVYSLGALLYRAVTGSHVFGAGMDRMELVRTKLTGEAPPLTTGRLDPMARGLAHIVACALERNPAARYQTAEHMRADLSQLRERMPGRWHANSTAPQRPPENRSWRRMPAVAVRRVVVTAATILTILIGVAMCARLGHSQPSMAARRLPVPHAQTAAVASRAGNTNRLAPDPERVMSRAQALTAAAAGTDE
jgi:serine/threonine protein kinase